MARWVGAAVIALGACGGKSNSTGGCPNAVQGTYAVADDLDFANPGDCPMPMMGDNSSFAPPITVTVNGATATVTPADQSVRPGGCVDKLDGCNLAGSCDGVERSWTFNEMGFAGYTTNAVTDPATGKECSSRYRTTGVRK